MKVNFRVALFLALTVALTRFTSDAQALKNARTPTHSVALDLDLDLDLSEPEIFEQLISSEWRHPAGNANIVPNDDVAGTISFTKDKCSYSDNLLWLPGRATENTITGISTAGTISPEPSEIDKFFFKLDGLKSQFEQSRKFPYQSVNGLTSLKWNFIKDDKRSGYIFFEDGSAARFIFTLDGTLYLAGRKCLPFKKSSIESHATRAELSKFESSFFRKLTDNEWVKDSRWKVDPRSSPPERLKFERSGHLNLRKDSRGVWIQGAQWSLINRNGMHILFHAADSYYKCYPFDNQSFEAKLNTQPRQDKEKIPVQLNDWETPTLMPSMISDSELALVIELPTHTKFGSQRYEHRFVK